MRVNLGQDMVSMIFQMVVIVCQVYLKVKGNTIDKMIINLKNFDWDAEAENYQF